MLEWIGVAMSFATVVACPLRGFRFVNGLILITLIATLSGWHI